MFKNYFMVTLRNLFKYRVFSAINILGLALGLMACLLILHYVHFELSYDTLSPHSERIYRVTTDQYQGEIVTLQDAMSFNALGPALKQDLPEVEAFARALPLVYRDGFTLIKDGIKHQEKKAYFADPSFLDFFPYQTLQGNAREALKEPYAVVLTQSLARKYFGDKNPLNQSFRIVENQFTHLYTVRAVLKDVPENTHLKFNMLMAYNTVWSAGKRLNWNVYDNYTYIQVKKGTDAKRLQERVHRLTQQKYLKASSLGVRVQSLQSIHLYSDFTYEAEVNGSAQIVYFLILVALLIVLIAWINYVNLSTARSVDRAKEVGLRKVLGANRKQLIHQFFIEAVLVNGMALWLAVYAMSHILPGYSQLMGRNLPLEPWRQSYFWVLLALLLGIGVILSGTYPALVLSSFRPAQVLKGKFRNSRQGLFLRRSLIVFQFTTSMILIAATLAVYWQIRHMQSQDPGLNIEQIAILDAPRYQDEQVSTLESEYPRELRTFGRRVQELGSVQSIAYSDVIVAGPSPESYSGPLNRAGAPQKEKGLTYYIAWIDEQFMPTYQIKLLAGRNFDRKIKTDAAQKILINQAASERLGFSSPQAAVGQKINTARDTYEIIGVVNNYNRTSLKHAIEPTLYRLGMDSGRAYFSIKLQAGANIPATLDQVEEIWNQMFSDQVFAYTFADQQFDAQYKADLQLGRIFAIFALLAIFVACFGLFGLSSYHVGQRSKEIGIRKVLGAKLSDLLRLLSQEVVQTVLVSALVAVPITYFILEAWLQQYAYRIQVQWWFFVLPALAVMLISLLTISYQTLKATTINPVQVLRDE